MFQESAYRSGRAPSDSTRAEAYELFEGGWIDRALEFLGLGPWAIGRPKNGQKDVVLSQKHRKTHSSFPTSAPD